MHEKEIGSIFLGTLGKESLDKLWKEVYKKKEQPSDIEIREIEKNFLSQKFLLESERIFFLKQEHGIQIHHIQKKDIEKNKKNIYYALGDALYTWEKNICLLIRTADCLPCFFILEEEKKTLGGGIIHAGWRGLQKNILGKTLHKVFEQRIKTKNKRKLYLRVLIGAHASQEQYYIQEDVAQYFPEEYKSKIKNDIYAFRMQALAKKQIEDSILAFSSLDIEYQYQKDIEDCTMKENSPYYSHRRGNIERNLNFVYFKT